MASVDEPAIRSQITIEEGRSEKEKWGKRQEKRENAEERKANRATREMERIGANGEEKDNEM